MSIDTQQAILQLLETQYSMTLATCQNNQPWAATVFYVSDADFNLYFVSDAKTRHGSHLADQAWAAAAIQPNCQHWSDIQGLQLEGRVKLLNKANTVRALTRYLSKFEQIKTLIEQPQDANEKIISARLLTANFYCLSPERIRLIDNRRHFGYKAELVL